MRYDNRTQSAFERLLLIELQTQKSVSSITATLAEFAQRDNISDALKRKLTDWISGVGELQIVWLRGELYRALEYRFYYSLTDMYVKTLRARALPAP